MIKSILLVFVVLLSTMHSTVAFAGPKFKAKTSLVGDTVMKGKVQVKEHKCSLRLGVHVNRATPLTTFDVWVNGEVVGQIFTNPGGSGRLRMNRPLHSLHVGDMISVGPVSGILGVKGGGNQAQTLNLAGEATTADGVRSIVQYSEAQRNGVWDQTMLIKIENGEPWQSVPVFVNGVFITAMLPGDDGSAELRMRSEAFIDDASAWQALPSDCPRLGDGSQVQVGTASVTLDKTS